MMPSMIRPKSFFFLELVFTTPTKYTLILPDICMCERKREREVERCGLVVGLAKYSYYIPFNAIFIEMN